MGTRCAASASAAIRACRCTRCRGQASSRPQGARAAAIPPAKTLRAPAEGPEVTDSICYCFSVGAPIHLLDIFGKGEKANLTKAEQTEMVKVARLIVAAGRAKDGKEGV